MVGKKLTFILGVLALSLLLVGFVSACHCGDGEINVEGEQCDDGNKISGDGCSSNCKLESFCPLDEGDYDVVIDIDYDMQSDSSSKVKSSKFPVSLSSGKYSVTLVSRDYYVGREDTPVNEQLHEQYFLSFFKNSAEVAISPSTTDLADGVSFAQINEVVIGDLYLSNGADSIQAIHSEISNVPTSGFPNSLTAVCVGLKKVEEEPFCGNGEKEEGEQCDNALLNGVPCWPLYGTSCTYCSSSCKLKTITNYCGDGIKQACEECDDGNTENGDGCSSECKNEIEEPSCGDGIINQEEEQCDDGNTNSGDGCSSTCQLEQSPPECGNDVKEAGEECDDGNTENGDGCSSTCTIEEDDDDETWKEPFEWNFCESSWKCSGWSECLNDVMTRGCYDENHCEIEYNKPLEQTSCNSLSKVYAEEKGNYIWVLIGIIIFLILLIILVNLLK